MKADERRISVGLTQPERDELQQLARRCNTSVSVLGQLAVRHLLLQSRNGAIPMLAPLQMASASTNLERAQRGGLTNVAAWRTEAAESIDHHQAALNFLDAKATLDRLPTQ